MCASDSSPRKIRKQNVERLLMRAGRSLGKVEDGDVVMRKGNAPLGPGR